MVPSRVAWRERSGRGKRERKEERDDGISDEQKRVEGDSTEDEVEVRGKIRR